MLKYIIRRLFYGLFVFLGVISLIFFLFHVVLFLRGDPARMMLGQRADIASVEAINKDHGRDKPLGLQYLNYLNDLSPVSFHTNKDSTNYWYLDDAKYSNTITLFKTSHSSRLVLKAPYLRRSYQSKRKVNEIIAEAFPKTALLAITAMGFAIVAGLIAGIFSALKKNSFFDRLAMVIAVLGMSLPSFFAAILIAWIFAYLLVDCTDLNMVGSLYEVDDFGRGEYMQIKNLILPALTLGIRPLAVITELSRNSLLEVLSQDYIRTARAKGLSEFKVISRHALRNALNPVITAVSGWLASLLAGAVFVEYVFDWKGLGVVIVDALQKYDFPVVMGCVLFISALLVFINIFVDIIYASLDPRIRLK